jgi:hypothetical protein
MKLDTITTKVAFFKNYDEQTPSINPPFSSAYIAKGIFRQAINFAEIQKLT